jgi:hypothetical protein
MKIHPYANLFPMCSDDEVQQLADDIAKNGLRQPIVTDADEMILDGRNRSAACAIAGVKPIYEPFVGNDAAKLAFVVSVNVHRRHLTTQQRAEIAAKIATMNVGDNQHSKKKKQGGSNDPPSKKVSTKEAAKLMNVSPASVKRAKAAKNPTKAAKDAAAKPGKATPTKKPEQNPASVVRVSDSVVTPELMALFGKKDTDSAEPDELNVDAFCQRLFDTLSPDQQQEVCQFFMDKLGWHRDKKEWSARK